MEIFCNSNSIESMRFGSTWIDGRCDCSLFRGCAPFPPSNTSARVLSTSSSRTACAVHYVAFNIVDALYSVCTNNLNQRTGGRSSYTCANIVGLPSSSFKPSFNSSSATASAIRPAPQGFFEANLNVFQLPSCAILRAHLITTSFNSPFVRFCVRI